MGMSLQGERDVKLAIVCAMIVGLAMTSAASEDKAVAGASAILATSQPVVTSEAAPVGNNSSPSVVPVVTPAPATMVVIKRPVATPHRFLDVKNCSGLAALGAGLTGDALSTQKGLGLPGYHEMNPIARPFVQNRPGAAMYSAASFAFVGGGMYFAHKTNHHKLERILPFAVAGWEGLLTFRNYHLISNSTSNR